MDTAVLCQGTCHFWNQTHACRAILISSGVSPCADIALCVVNALAFLFKWQVCAKIVLSRISLYRKNHWDNCPLKLSTSQISVYSLAEAALPFVKTVLYVIVWNIMKWLLFHK